MTDGTFWVSHLWINFHCVKHLLPFLSPGSCPRLVSSYPYMSRVCVWAQETKYPGQGVVPVKGSVVRTLKSSPERKLGSRTEKTPSLPVRCPWSWLTWSLCSLCPQTTVSLVIDAVFKSSKLRKCWKFVLQPYHFTLSLNYFARHPASVRNTFASLSHCWSQPPSLPPPPNSVLRALGESPKDCVGYGSKVHPPSFRPISHTQVVSTLFLIIRVREWPCGKELGGYFLWPPSCAGKSHLYCLWQAGP